MQRQLLAEQIDAEQDDAGPPRDRCWLRGTAICLVDKLVSPEILSGTRGRGGGSRHAGPHGRWVTGVSRECCF